MKSIIIRGAISHPNKPHNHILDVVRTIRQWFDEELIICTWKHEAEKIPIKANEYIDKVIFITDPGAGPVQNIKRQMYSFLAGLQQSLGETLLVTRSDILFHENIFNHIDKYPNYNSTLRFVDDKIVVGNIMSINPNSNENPNTYRVSDWFHCGKRNDIEKLISGFEFILDSNETKLQQLFSTGKMCTEKLWMLSILHAYFNTDLYDSSDIDPLCWQFILNNFIVLNSISTLNTYNLNYPNQPQNMYCYITEEEYSRQYNLL
jgi:hypothetical protein